MSTPLADDKRDILPRWRDVKTTVAVGELRPRLASEKINEPPADFLSPKLREWEAEGSMPLAEEAIAAAIVLNRPAEAKRAAEYVLANQNDASRATILLAKRIITPNVTAGTSHSVEDFRSDIQHLKALLRTEPRNAFAWVDLARDYIILGLKERAMKAIASGLALAGDNRHVLRSASRLYTHLGDGIRAHRLLLKASATRFDPWLIAAELSSAAFANRSPLFAKTGIRMLDSQNFSAFDLGELASAVATLEAKEGSVRLARKHFRDSLVRPNENVVAQARWAATNKIIDIDETVFSLKNAFEARAWHSYYSGEWANALASARRWLQDQPFSVAPAVHASYVASVDLEDFQAALDMASLGLMANPHQPILLNNQAYALANLGRLDEAETALQRIHKSRPDEQVRVTSAATAGLIAFRRGNIEVGRRHYEAAMAEARAQSDRQLLSKAMIFLALEELRARTADAPTLAGKALASSSEFANIDFVLLRSRLENFVARYFAAGDAAEVYK